MKSVILELIPHKETGLITAKRISKITGYTECYVRKVINDARVTGTPICSTRYGYYYSDDAEDIADTINFLTRRVNTQLSAINGLKNIRGI